jgi:hypothetical protein
MIVTRTSGYDVRVVERGGPAAYVLGIGVTYELKVMSRKQRTVGFGWT